jgi:hypothetical protein
MSTHTGRDLVGEYEHTASAIFTNSSCKLWGPKPPAYPQCTSRLAYPLMDDPLPNTAFLFDSSMGTGKVPAQRPPPVLHPGVHCGYAGGLGPHNLHEELVKIAEAVCSYSPTRSRPVWVDMESSLRATVGGRDVFDLNQTLECIQVIFDLGLKGEEDCGHTEA